jgi:quinoprotein glucose dehydrogenase
MTRAWGLVLATVATAACAPQPDAGGWVGWPAYGGDVEGSRFLPVATIDTANVRLLEPAWTYRTLEAEPEFATEKPASFQSTPIAIDGVLYFNTPLGRVIALDAATGEEIWSFDPRIRRDVTYGDFASRGVSAWLDGDAAPDAPCRLSIYVANAQSQLIRLDARDGAPCAAFGRNGMVDLLEGLRIPPFEDEAYSMTSPPLVAGELVVVGSSIGDNSRPSPASGEVRAYDARTGALRWSWDPIPQSPLDPAYAEWGGELAHRTGGANAWSVLAADPARDLVFVPTTSPAPDYYGALRRGPNRYASSVVALRLSTGELVWAFQTVHHDLWDFDNASPPALSSVWRGGEGIPVVLQATKTGMLFVLHRETGEPVFPVEERAVPASDIPGEQASTTQPFTALTPPLSPHSFAAEDVWGITESEREACRHAVQDLRNEGIFTPPSTRGTLMIPSNIGGAHWGGVATDPGRAIAVVPVNRVAAVLQLFPRDGFDFEAHMAEDARLGYDFEYNGMVGTPYVMRRRLLTSPSGLPCSPPPWGALVAVSLASGRMLWNVPLGSMAGAVPAEVAGGVSREWGSPNLGGAIATAGGVVFIGAALDRALHAFDIETGRELWRGQLPGSARATPMSYRTESGEQFVVVAVGGGEVFGAADHLVAFRLPTS